MIKKILLLSPLAILIAAALLLPSGKQNLPYLNVFRGSGGEVKSYAIYTSDGDILFAERIDNIRKSILNRITIKAPGIKIIDPVGIVENPPEKCITDIRESVLESLAANRRVLLIYIDGLGYELYEQAVASGRLPYISSLGKASKALTVYPSITDVTFASMVTGVTPRYTGIHSREKKPLQADTIFDTASREGKSSIVIEGNMRILTDEVETILNIDENKNGTIDDEIYNSAIKELQDPPYILLVHFHSYDDMGHKYGPDSAEALDRLEMLDGYAEALISAFKGTVIITSDHGMHDEGEGGNHGSFSALDMFIPIILIK